MTVVDGDASRPVPVVDELTEEFWTGGGTQELRIATCAGCGRLFHPPGPICPYCSGRRITHTTVTGLGTVDSYTVVRRPWIVGYETPYVVARVRLAEDPDLFLVTNIVGAEPDEVRIGQSVEVAFEPRGEVHVPVFRPRP